MAQTKRSNYRKKQEFRITIDEFNGWLLNVSIARRRAILFFLETGIPLDRVVALTWRELKGMQVSGYARKMCQAMPRHIKLDYVFWEYMPNGAVAPLFGLMDSAYVVSQGKGVEELRRLYLNMIPVDRQADLLDFLDCASSVLEQNLAH